MDHSVQAGSEEVGVETLGSEGHKTAEIGLYGVLGQWTEDLPLWG